jgi:hypothetical protein
MTPMERIEAMVHHLTQEPTGDDYIKTRDAIRLAVEVAEARRAHDVLVGASATEHTEDEWDDLYGAAVERCNAAEAAWPKWVEENQ